MSIKLMSQVWEKELTPGQQRVLLALCDHANDQGTNCYPSVGYIAWKIGVTPKTVSEMIGQLERIGGIQVKREAGKSSRYRIRLDNLPDKAPFRGQKMEEEWPADPPQNVMGQESAPPTKGNGYPPQNVGTPPTKCNDTPHKTSHKPSDNHQINRELEPSDAAGEDARALADLESSFRNRKKKSTQSAGSGGAAARTDDPRIWGLVSAYFEGRGLDDHKMPASQRSAAYNVLRDLGPEWSQHAVRACTQYLGSQQWYQEPGRLTAKAVMNAIYDWDNKGRPTMEAPRGAQREVPALKFASGMQQVANAMKEYGA